MDEFLLLRTLKGKCQKQKRALAQIVFIFVKRGPGYPNYPIRKKKKKKETLPTSKLEIKNLLKSLL